MQMRSKNDLTPEEKETFRKPKESFKIMTANGTAYTNEEATVYVNNLDLFIEIELLKDSTVVQWKQG